MSWITLTEARIANRLADAELTAVKTAAIGSGQTGSGVLADAIGAVTAEVRGYVAACSRNVLGDGATIPVELESAALALLRRYLFTRLPGMRALYNDARERETDDALRLLRDVAACKFAVMQPETAAADQVGGPAAELVSSRERIATREGVAGL